MNARRQREAYQALELWYQDWGTTLRSELGYHDEVRLGLTRVKRANPPVAELFEPDEAEDVG